MNRTVAMLVLAIVMVAGVSQGAEWVDFADHYANMDPNAKAWTDGVIVELLGTNVAATLKANGYLHGEMVDAWIAVDSPRSVNRLMGLMHQSRYTVSKDYHDQVLTSITNSVLTWHAGTDNLLNQLTHRNAEKHQAAYTWVVANQDAELTDPGSPTLRQLTWNRKARGATRFRVAEEVELIAVNEHDGSAKNRILEALVPKVRAKMRADGETFVGAAGRSNVLARLEVIMAQLNSGSASGIEATLRAHNVTCPDRDRTAMVTRCTNLIPDLMDGTVKPDGRRLKLLQNVLGAVEYEKWRVAYNTGGSYTMP